ncbi:MAG: hypothetical protein K2J67_06080 [Lachnospiraceae bacterium]|nr:hypothetical protein [Lachnospiraceae bacterium]
MDIKIRNVDPMIVKRINERAAKHGLSREEYLRRLLTKTAIIDDVAIMEQKYDVIIQALTERLEQANDVIALNTAVIERVLDDSS